MPNKAFADIITGWQKLLATVTANKDDLQSLDSYRQQLEAEVTAAQEANLRQSTSQAGAQQATRDLEGSLTRGHDLADKLRFGIKSRYGKRSEKLTEFGLKVFRGGGKKKSASGTPPPQGGSTQGTSPPPQVGPPQGSSPPPVATKTAPQGATSEPHNPS
ncbi:MAG TPA: hypothetical protein VGM86_09185 [Thermoanaerobaculia bacterium]